MYCVDLVKLIRRNFMHISMLSLLLVSIMLGCSEGNKDRIEELKKELQGAKIVAQEALEQAKEMQQNPPPRGPRGEKGQDADETRVTNLEAQVKGLDAKAIGELRTALKSKNFLEANDPGFLAMKNALLDDDGNVVTYKLSEEFDNLRQEFSELQSKDFLPRDDPEFQNIQKGCFDISERGSLEIKEFADCVLEAFKALTKALIENEKDYNDSTKVEDYKFIDLRDLKKKFDTLNAELDKSLKDPKSGQYVTIKELQAEFDKTTNENLKQIREAIRGAVDILASRKDSGKSLSEDEKKNLQAVLGAIADISSK